MHHIARKQLPFVRHNLVRLKLINHKDVTVADVIDLIIDQEAVAAGNAEKQFTALMNVNLLILILSVLIEKAKAFCL